MTFWFKKSLTWVIPEFFRIFFLRPPWVIAGKNLKLYTPLPSRVGLTLYLNETLTLRLQNHLTYHLILNALRWCSMSILLYSKNIQNVPRAPPQSLVPISLVKYKKQDIYWLVPSLVHFLSALTKSWRHLFKGTVRQKPSWAKSGINS
jgi:hypothetical protein